MYKQQFYIHWHDERADLLRFLLRHLQLKELFSYKVEPGDLKPVSADLHPNDLLVLVVLFVSQIIIICEDIRCVISYSGGEKV